MSFELGVGNVDMPCISGTARNPKHDTRNSKLKTQNTPPVHRTTQLQRLKTETFDLCIIGAGASGAGCALDAALRGLKVALVEKEDFAAGTSSKSTKLIHGGVRYLEQAFKNLDFAQLKQVRHGLEERHLLLANAPHLARPLGLITPVSSWVEGLYFSIGLKLYGWFAAGKDTLPKSRWLSKKEALRRMPGLSRNIHSAVLYYDGQLDDARYCVALAKSACQLGAAISNHTEVVGFQKDANHKIIAAQVKDTLGDDVFEVRAKVYLNCTGPYADKIRFFANPAEAPRIRPSKGVHAMLPKSVLDSNDAMLIPKTKDGRVVFAIPFEGKVMLGTTDDDYENLAIEPALEAREIDFLLETLQPFVSPKVDRSQVSAGFGGLRPLLAAKPGKGTKNLVRDHEVETDAASGLISLLGGKWTTYRLMAQDAVDAVCLALSPQSAVLECRTKTHVLAGGEGYRYEDWKDIQANVGMDADICQHLVLKYGADARQIMAICQEQVLWTTRIHPSYPYVLAEAVFAARHEMACTLRDFLARRIRLEVADWEATSAALAQTAFAMASVLHWSEAEKTRQIVEYQKLISHFQQCAST